MRALTSKTDFHQVLLGVEQLGGKGRVGNSGKGRHELQTRDRRASVRLCLVMGYEEVCDLPLRAASWSYNLATVPLLLAHRVNCLYLAIIPTP